MDRTKKYKIKKTVLQIISFCLTVAPLVVGVVLGFSNNEVESGRKLFLGFTILTSFFLVMLNVAFKYQLRSPLFLILLGIYFALDNILTILIILSVGIIIDEFVVEPMLKSAKTKYTINKEIDKR